MKKRLFSLVLALVLIIPISFGLFGCDEVEENAPTVLENNFAMIGNTTYATLQEAVNAVPKDGTETTIKLVGNARGGGVKVNENESTTEFQNIVFDFGGNTYYMNNQTVGSTGTETNGFQLLKGGVVKFKNGKLENMPTGAKIMLQNYSDLTLENFTVDNSKSITVDKETAGTTKDQVYGQYAVSNNYGSLTLKGDTNILARRDHVAFDLWYGLKSSYSAGLSVNIGEDFTGHVDGIIEYGKGSYNNDGWQNLTALTIAGGEFTNFKIVASSTNSLDGANIKIKGGTYNLAENYTFPEQFLEEGYTAQKNSTTNVYSVSRSQA